MEFPSFGETVVSSAHPASEITLCNDQLMERWPKWYKILVGSILTLSTNNFHFVTLNRFCLLNETPHPCLATHPPVLNRKYQNGWNTNQNQWKIHTLWLFTLYLSFKAYYYKNSRIQPLSFLFLLFCISFYINRYHFSPVFRTLFNIIW